MKNYFPNLLKSTLTLIAYALSMVNLQAQGLDFLRSTGKIYSVVAVVVVIFLGIIFFLYKIDNKLTKLENHIKNEQ
ncbi:MAG: CcmD family protein [Saprospiraceae bacterium]